jgi:hypothetical protein
MMVTNSLKQATIHDQIEPVCHGAEPSLGEATAALPGKEPA